MTRKPPQPCIVPDSYLVMAKRPPLKKKDGLCAIFPSDAEMIEATQKMVADIRRLAKKHDETVQIDTRNLLTLGIVKLKCDRHFAELVADLKSVAHVEQERSVAPAHKSPKFNI